MSTSTIVSLIIAVAGMIAAFIRWRSSSASEELGKLKEREANAKAHSDLIAGIGSADPSVVPDDQAFGRSAEASRVPGPVKE